jgi:hypothetical protein
MSPLLFVEAPFVLVKSPFLSFQSSVLMVKSTIFLLVTHKNTPKTNQTHSIMVEFPVGSWLWDAGSHISHALVWSPFGGAGGPEAGKTRWVNQLSWDISGWYPLKHPWYLIWKLSSWDISAKNCWFSYLDIIYTGWWWLEHEWIMIFRGVAQPPTRYVYESFINCTLICGAHGRLESYMYIHKIC